MAALQTDVVAPLSWRFLVGLISALISFGILSSSVWEKSNFGRMLALISPSETSCIISSSLVCTARSGVLADLKGKFFFYLTY